MAILKTLTLYKNEVITAVKACVDAATSKLNGLVLFVGSQTDVSNDKQLVSFGDLQARSTSYCYIDKLPAGFNITSATVYWNSLSVVALSFRSI